MNRRDFLAGLVCAVATLSLDVGGSTSLAITPPPEEVPTEPSENYGSSWITCDETVQAPVAVVIGSLPTCTGAIIVATANAYASTGTGSR